MSILRSLFFSLLPLCLVFAAPVAAEAHCPQHCRHIILGHNRWGYVALVQGSWGLGGIADAPWVGGSVFGVSSYGPYPYGLYPWSK
jgi:hypothetical protein